MSKTFLVIIPILLFHFNSEGRDLKKFCDNYRFNPERITELAEQVKSKIRLQINEDREIVAYYEQVIRELNKRRAEERRPAVSKASRDIAEYMGPAQERLENRSDNCFNNFVVNELINNIEGECKLLHLNNFCLTKAEQVDSYLSAPPNFSTSNGRRVNHCDLEKQKSNSLVNLKQSIGKYTACHDNFEIHVLDNKQCLGAYRKVFDDQLKDLLSRNCTIKAMDQAENDFKEYMGGDMGPVKQFCNIVDIYTKMRVQSIDYAEKLSDFDASLQEYKQSLGTDVRSCKAESRNTASAEAQ